MPTGLKFSRVDVGHPKLVLGEFGEGRVFFLLHLCNLLGRGGGGVNFMHKLHYEYYKP